MSMLLTKTLNIFAYIGAGVLKRLSGINSLCYLSVDAAKGSLTAGAWPRTTRDVLVRQLLFTGIEAVPLISLMALLAGISVVAQAQMWLNRIGETDMLGPLMILVLFREFGPLLVNFVVIGRSGTAMATELANMKVNNEVSLLTAQGIDPTGYLVMPRVVGMMLSVFCLSVVFVTVSILVGYLSAVMLGITTAGPSDFFAGILKGLTAGDLLTLLAKTLIPGLFSGTIACYEGLAVAGSINEVPRAATRAVVKSIAALITITALIAVLSYAR